MNALDKNIDSPSPAKMLLDYRRMFSGDSLKLLLFWFTVLVVALLFWVISPSTLDLHVALPLRVLVFIDGFVLFGFGLLLALQLSSPFLARLAFPLVCSVLEVLKLMIESAQFLIDGILTRPLTISFLYPKDKDEKNA